MLPGREEEGFARQRLAGRERDAAERTVRMLDTRDLRSGMSLIAAGLAADGQSRLSPLETVERGYGRLVERLQGLGAKVAKMS